MSSLVSGGTAWQLEEAHHSRLGDVTASVTSSDSLPVLNPGDTLAVHYAGVPAGKESLPSWLVLLDNPASDATSGKRAKNRCQ